MDTIKCLTTLPSTDGNFLSVLATASLAQLKFSVQIMKLNPEGKNSSRIKACESRIATLSKGKSKIKKSKATPQKVTKVTPLKPASTMVATPTKKAEPEPMKVTPLDGSKRPKMIPFKNSNGNHTYAECEKKLKAELKKFAENDSAYVVEGILERCRVDKDFCNNVMREDKSYEGFFAFMYKAAMKGYCEKVGSEGGILSANQALELAFDYFNGEEDKSEEDKAEDNKGTTFIVPNPEKKATTKKTKTTSTKKETKKSTYEQLSLFD